MSSLLRHYAGEVDLIYIDPPFATGADFSYEVEAKQPSALEETAYRDTWGRGTDSYLTAVEKARQEIATAEERLDARDAVLDRRARAVSRREDAVSLVENTIEQNTIEGDGLYEVGGDIKAGTYKTEGSPGCYYAVLSSPDTFDILNNNNTSGPAVVTVSDGQYLELSRCADWVWQG